MHFQNFNKKKNKKQINSLKNIINKNIMGFIMMLMLILVFFQEFNIFRNIYYLTNENYYQRAIRVYEKTFFSGFCKKSSHGYLFYIKNKYSNNFNKNQIPKIINNFNGREEYWIFSDVNAKISDKQIIVLNKSENIDFKKYKIIDEYENKCFFIEKKND
tara:strand:+ start:81 stop:557 length:477 start_codon:yes stop_codon:yes gene_type:complete